MENNSELLVTIGLNIRKLRKQYGLSREALAEKANRSSTHIWRIENGITDIKITTLANIAESLKVEISYLLIKNN